MNYEDEQIKAMFDSVDVDETGIIHYTEFLAAALEAHGHIEEDQLAEAFDRLDADDSGFITMANLRQIMGTAYTKEKAEEFIQEADLDGNGKVCWSEFKAMFEKHMDLDQKHLKELLPQETMADEDANEEGLLGVDADIPLESEI